MIYGRNWGAQPIPVEIARKFKKSTKEVLAPGGWRKLPRGISASLQGVASSPTELAEMLIIAENGRRRIHIEERASPMGTLYGLYVYYSEDLA